MGLTQPGINPESAMEILESLDTIRDRCAAWKLAGQRFALVPTLGHLHAGHRQLIEAAKAESGRVAVSCFVDPLEFGPNEDFYQYPRDAEADRVFCDKAEVDLLLLPSQGEIYPPGHSTYLLEDKVSQGLCGISRTHHFRGVATGFMKIFGLVQPDQVWYSDHEPQRVAVIRRIVRDFHLAVAVRTCAGTREPDGLASDARNTFLNPEQRRDATRIYASLRAGFALYEQGNRSVDRITAEVITQMRQSRRLHVLYVAIVDRESMAEVREIVPGRTLLCTAVLIDQIRLLDHLAF